MEQGRGQGATAKRFLRGVAAVLAVVAILRLLAFAYVFAVSNNPPLLQMDFAAFYTAGRAASEGLSPYVNYVDLVPPIWDGTAAFSHSRYLYPPPSAHGFRVLTLVDYPTAKTVWTGLTLAAMGFALLLALARLGLQRDSNAWIVTSLVAAGSYPMVAMLERGQLDSVTLLLLLGAITLMRTPRGELVGGALVAVATMFKPHCLFLLVFALLRGRFRMAVGFLAACVLLLGLGSILDGPSAIWEYVREDLPRIARHGEGGPDDTRLPRESFMGVIGGVQPGYTVIDGFSFKRSYFRFVLNATLVQTPWGQWVTEATGGMVSATNLAWILLALAVVFTYWWSVRFGPPANEDDPAGDFLYWQLALIWILLCGPVTWAMTAVWLLPMTGLVVYEARRLRGRAHVASLVVATCGLLLAVMPDPYANYMMLPLQLQFLMDHKYVVAELLCVAGLFGVWRARNTGDAAVAVAAAAEPART